MLRIEGVTISYPEYHHLGGCLDRRSDDKEVTIQVSGTWGEFYYMLGWGKHPVGRLQSDQVLTHDIPPNARRTRWGASCRLTMLEVLQRRGLLDEIQVAHIQSLMEVNESCSTSLCCGSVEE